MYAIAGSGPPRKYYRIGSEGMSHLDRWTGEWEALSTGVTSVLNGGIGDD